MKKFLFYLVATLLLVGAVLRLSMEFEAAQDVALRGMADAAQGVLARGVPEPDGIQAFVCGSSSPLPAPGRAQACIAVFTPSHFYIVDVGAGATANLMTGRLPLQRLQGVLVTHHHSDHIAELYEANINSWVAGRPLPLMVYGPKGVKQVVDGLNDAYEPDRSYRVAHHGRDLLPPELGVLAATRVNTDWVFRDGDLTITAYAGDHAPVSPALGYRFDYRGRSIVVSGDSLVTDATVDATRGVDLVFHDALSEPVVSALAAAAEDHGLDRQATILTDILDYHASTDALVALKEQVGMLVYYHLVPAPRNLVMEKVFARDLPDNYRLASDGERFFLPSNSDEIIVSQ